MRGVGRGDLGYAGIVKSDPPHPLFIKLCPPPNPVFSNQTLPPTGIFTMLSWDVEFSIYKYYYTKHPPELWRCPSLCSLLQHTGLINLKYQMQCSKCKIQNQMLRKSRTSPQFVTTRWPYAPKQSVTKYTQFDWVTKHKLHKILGFGGWYYSNETLNCNWQSSAR